VPSNLRHLSSAELSGGIPVEDWPRAFNLLLRRRIETARLERKHVGTAHALPVSRSRSHMKTMKSIKRKTAAILYAVALIGSLAGCTTPSGRPDYTANGALIGGASGAAIGALADRRAPGAGALIGGAAGVIAGGVVGHTMDQQAEARAQSAPPVAYAPPPPPPETVVVGPGPDYVWVNGEWVWQGGTWVWVGGHWALPPHPHAVWMAPRWERGPHGWCRVEGYWR